MTTSFDDVTWTVAELHDTLNATIEGTFGQTVWVTGELRSMTRSKQNHTYFDLVDPDAQTGRTPPKLAITLFDGYRRRINAQVARSRSGVRIEEGSIVRICGELRTYPEQSRLQLVMTGIDLRFTQGAAERQREAALAALSADGLLGANAALALPRPALRVAVVTSRHSAAEADVLSELARSAVGFRVTVLDTRVQGHDAHEAVATALRAAGELAVDVVLLVRGGGSRADLATFDHLDVGRAVANLGVPVLTGIGHETDRSVADEVAHTAAKTPTAAAGVLVDLALEVRRELDAVAAALPTAARGRLVRSAAELARAARVSAMAARGHLGREGAAIEDRAGRLATAAPAILRRAGDELSRRSATLGSAAPRRLDDAERRLSHIGAVVSAHDPALVLARGWSLTRTTDGALVRDAAVVVPGTELVTTVASGTLTSTVSTTDPAGAGPVAESQPGADTQPGKDGRRP